MEPFDQSDDFAGGRCPCCPYGVHFGVDFTRKSAESTLRKRLPTDTHSDYSNSNSISNRFGQLRNPFQVSTNGSIANSSSNKIKMKTDSNLKYPLSDRIDVTTTTQHNQQILRILDDSDDASFNDAILRFEEVLRDLQSSWRSGEFNRPIQLDNISTSDMDGLSLESPPVSPCSSSNGSSTAQSTINKATLAQIRSQMAKSLQMMRNLEEQVRCVPVLKQKILLLQEEKLKLLANHHVDHSEQAKIDENEGQILRLENSGLITPPVRRRKHLLRSISDSGAVVEEDLVNVTSGKQIARFSFSKCSQDASTQTTDYHSSEAKSNGLASVLLSSFSTEEFKLCQPSTVNQCRSIGTMACFVPCLPKRSVYTITDLKGSDILLQHKVNTRPMRISCGTDPIKTVIAHTYVQATAKTRSVGTKPEITCRDVGTVTYSEKPLFARFHHKAVQSDIITTRKLIDKAIQVQERFSHCQVKQMETIGIGDASVISHDVGVETCSTESHIAVKDTFTNIIMASTSAIPATSTTTATTVTTTTLVTTATATSTATITSSMSSSPTVVSRIPRLTHSTGVENLSGTSLDSGQKQIIIEETQNEILVYRNPNAPTGKHRSNFPNLMAVHHHSGMSLLSDVCKITESESEESDDEKLSNSSDEGSYNLESEKPTTSIEKVEPSRELKAALKVLNDTLTRPERSTRPASFKSLQIIEKEWFRISAQKDSNHVITETYLDYFESLSKQLLNRVVNLTDGNGNTALHYAISYSNFDVVTVLLDSKVCDANKRNKAGYTAIMLVSLACISNDIEREVIRRLFQLGDVNIRAKQNGQTALMLASSHGQFITCKLLIEAGSALNVQDNDGSTALMCAAEHGHVDVVRLLLSHPDCDPNIADNDGSTALSIAMEGGHKDIGLMLYASTNMLSRGSAPYASLRRSQSKAAASSLRRTGSFTGRSQAIKNFQLAPSPPPRRAALSKIAARSQKR